jgi:hypothetical protein
MGNAYLWNEPFSFLKSLWQPILSVQTFLHGKITLLHQNTLEHYVVDNRTSTFDIKEKTLLL